MNSDRLEGGIRHLRGRVKTATGALRGAPGRQAEGAFDQAAGAAQYAYGRARALADEARSRGEAFADEAYERGRHVRSRAVHHGRDIARRADDNRATTLALVAAVAFGIGWLARPNR